MIMNTLIIFDCFGVIFDEIAPVFFSRYLPDEQAAKVKDKIFIPADLGELEYEQIFEKISQEMHMDKEDIKKEWEDLIRLREEMIPVIEGLREKSRYCAAFKRSVRLCGNDF